MDRWKLRTQGATARVACGNLAAFFSADACGAHLRDQ
jgi:hypothetical protein